MGRRPPEPSPDHAPIADWLGRQMPDLQPVLRELDATITGSLPGGYFAVARKRPYYGVSGLGWVIELAAYDVSVNVVFFGGADFAEPPPLGSADRTRYVKVTSLEEARQPVLRRWIDEAGRTPGWR